MRKLLKGTASRRCLAFLSVMVFIITLLPAGSAGAQAESAALSTPTPASVTLEAWVSISGPADYTAGQFSFSVYENGIRVATGTNNAFGWVGFSTITYTQAGEHTYTMKEISLGGNGWIIDTDEYCVTVTVTEADGVLTALVAYEFGTMSYFHNEYMPGRMTLNICALLMQDGKQTGDGTEFTVRLADADGRVLGQYTLKANGDVVSIPNLEANTSYTLTELTATGYKAVGYTVMMYGSSFGSASGAVVRLDVSPFYSDASVDVILTNSPGEWEAVSGEIPAIAVSDYEEPPCPCCSGYSQEHYAYITGYPDGTMRPEAPVTRAEVATVFFRLMDDYVREENWTRENDFTDVKAADWFNNAVSVMANMSIINGYYDGSFCPNNNITRAELAKVAAMFGILGGWWYQPDGMGLGDFRDIEGHWAEVYIRIVAYWGLANGYEDGTYRPEQPITRAEFMTLMNRMFQRAPYEPEYLPEDMIQWSDNADVNAWYYMAVQEATNSHAYVAMDDDDGNLIWVPELNIPYEYWTEILPPRDWAALEREWAEAYS